MHKSLPDNSRDAYRLIGCAFALACALCACGGGAANVTVRAPAPAQGAPLPPPPSLPVPGSSLAVALEVELELIRARVDAALPQGQKQDWARVTREGSSPNIELRIRVEREPVQVSFSKKGLRTELPLRYWADVRGEVKSPLPWQKNKWYRLEQGSWGTREQPQRTKVVVRTRVEVSEAGDLRVASELEPLDPGPAPKGSFCVKAGIRICVDKRSFQGEVRDAFAQRVEPELRAALAKLERQLEREVDLRAHLQRGWQALRCPRALHRGGALACTPDANEQGVWLRLVPQRVVTGAPRRAGDRAHVRVAIDGAVELVRGAPPAPVDQPLLPIGRGDPTRDSNLNAEVALGYDLLSSQLAASLPRTELDLAGAGDAKLTGARIVAASAGGTAGLLLLELTLDGDLDAVLFGHAELVSEPGRLRLVQLRLTAESEQALARAVPELDRGALVRALEPQLAIPLDRAAALLAATIKTAIEAGVPHAQVATEISSLALTEPRLGPDGVLALLALQGRVRITIMAGD